MQIYTWCKPENDNDEPEKFKVDVKPGITMIIGTNGCGKSTFLKQLSSFIKGNNSWEEIEENNFKKYHVFLYSNEEQEKNAKSSWAFNGNMSKVAETFENSEGQDIKYFLFDNISRIGAEVRKAKSRNKKGVFLLFDGLDSGLSPDILDEIRTELFEFIIEEEKDLEIYIICSANSYEFCHNCNCINLSTHKTKMINSYDEFRKEF